MNEPPAHIDLFSGIGGFALAAAWAGFRTTVFCEIDSYCRKVLQKNFGAVAISDHQWKLQQKRSQQDFRRWLGDGPWLHSDIRQLDGTRCQGASLLTAGVPCQAASCAGKRRGRADVRWLWPEALRVLGEARPVFAVFENPPGILALESGVVFENLLSGMESLGYEIAPPIVIPACAVGAGHRRYRVFVVGHAPDAQRPGLEEREEQHARSELPSAVGSGGVDSYTAGGQAWSAGQPRECPGMVGPETDFGLLRAVHGVSRGMERHRRARIHALGNAVVPAQVYPILKAIRGMIP